MGRGGVKKLTCYVIIEWPTLHYFMILYLISIVTYIVMCNLVKFN